MEIVQVELHNISLYPENPRHERLEDRSDIIASLCKEEYVLRLAKDIADHGLNPLESFALFPENEQANDDEKHYFVAEGNRRLCAIMLLNDPDLAPPELRKKIEIIATNWTPIEAISAVIFQDFEATRSWLSRLHGGEQRGIGRRTWTTDQQQRFFTDKTKNKLAMTILDYAEKKGFISKNERKKKITTTQRFLSNTLMKEALGIDARDHSEILRNRNEEDFDHLVKIFVDDLKDGVNVTSRMNKDKINDYARKLLSTPKINQDRIEPEPLETETDSKKSTKKRRKTPPKSPARRDTLSYSPEFAQKLKSKKLDKAYRLYYSICSVSLENHTPLISIGCWSLLETLSASGGRTEDSSFESFFQPNKSVSLGLGKSNRDVKPITEAIQRISRYGNTTKHHKTGGSFDRDQLYHDMEAIAPLLDAFVDSLPIA